MEGSVKPEEWRKVPGWRLEVSDHGRTRGPGGKVLELSRENGTYRVKFRGGSDVDPTAARMFSVGALVLHVFADCPLNTRPAFIDGDRFNCRLDNLRSAGTFHSRAMGPGFYCDADPTAEAEIRSALESAAVAPSVVEAAFARNGFGRDWSAPDACIRVLVEKGFSTCQIAAGLGWLVRMVRERRYRLGISVEKPCQNPIKGEVWKKIVGYRAEVSNLGRLRGPRGITTGSMQNGRRRVQLITEVGGRSEMHAIAALVFSTFKGTPIRTRTRHLNLNPEDCRLVNLAEGAPDYRPDARRADTPWTPDQDKLLRKAASWAEGARLTGHSIAYVRKRMGQLGIVLHSEKGARRGKLTPLEHRDLDALNQAVAVLQKMGVDDVTINRGLRITMAPYGQRREVPTLAQLCALTLHDAGWKDGQIAQALGIAAKTVTVYMQKAGVRAPLPAGWSTHSGPVDFREGEEWRPVAGLPYSVSSYGRVANSRGHLLKPSLNPITGRRVVALADPSRKIGRYTCLVSRLVLAAFKPEINARQTRYLNGDVTDASLANLVPKADLTARAAGTTAGQAPRRGALPYMDPIWQMALQACPVSYRDTEMRNDDILSSMVLLYLEGRAATMEEAFTIARADYNRIMGTFNETSLDAPIGTSSLTRLDTISSDSVRA